MNKVCFVFGLVLMTSFSSVVQAKDVKVKITNDKSYAMVHADGERIKITRIQDTSHVIDGSFSKTSRPCPPFCINPLKINDKVNTVAELEVIQFMETTMYRGDGVLVDARTPSWYNKGRFPVQSIFLLLFLRKISVILS